MKFFAGLVAGLGTLVAATATMGCYLILFDEPEMPESLL